MEEREVLRNGTVGDFAFFTQTVEELLKSTLEDFYIFKIILLCVLFFPYFSFLTKKIFLYF